MVEFRADNPIREVYLSNVAPSTDVGVPRRILSGEWQLDMGDEIYIRCDFDQEILDNIKKEVREETKKLRCESLVKKEWFELE